MLISSNLMHQPCLIGCQSDECKTPVKLEIDEKPSKQIN